MTAKHKESIKKNAEQPTLYVVATPIGNVEDITRRACRILKEVSTVAAEDTRHTRKLLGLLGISRKRLISVREHNEVTAAAAVLAAARESGGVAYVTDAGTPGISDPGARLVRTLRHAGAQIVPIPGPSSLTTAISVSGISGDSVTFAGFLPRRKSERIAAIKWLAQSKRPCAIFETPRLIATTLTELSEMLGANTEATVCRELTKMHEEIRSGTLAELADEATNNRLVGRGEFVVVIDATTCANGDEEMAKEIFETLREELPPRQAAKIAAKISGISAQQIYQKFVTRS